MKISDMKLVLKEFIQSGVNVVPFLLGESGIGKSATIAQIAQELGYRLVDLRLAQMEPSDAIGMPRAVQDEKGDWVTVYARPFWFPTEDDEKTLVLLDELPQAPQDVRAAFFQFIYDKELFGHKLADKHVIVAAGNPAVGNYESMEMGTALKSRLAMFRVDTDPDEWLAWSGRMLDAVPAIRHVRNFIALQPDMLQQSDHNEHWETNQKPDPRAWFRLSEVLELCDIPEHLQLEVITSMVGRDAGIAFYRSMQDDLKKPVTAEEIFESPGWNEELSRRVKASSNDMLNATRNDIVAYARNNEDSTSVDVLCDVLESLPKEFIVIICKDILRLDNNMRRHFGKSERLRDIVLKATGEITDEGKTVQEVVEVAN